MNLLMRQEERGAQGFLKACSQSRMLGRVGNGNARMERILAVQPCMMKIRVRFIGGFGLASAPHIPIQPCVYSAAVSLILGSGCMILSALIYKSLALLSDLYIESLPVILFAVTIHRF